MARNAERGPLDLDRARLAEGPLRLGVVSWPATLGVMTLVAVLRQQLRDLQCH
jgi:hypothetical protein